MVREQCERPVYTEGLCILKELHQMSSSDGNILQLSLVCQFLSVSIAVVVCGHCKLYTLIFMQHHDLTSLESRGSYSDSDSHTW